METDRLDELISWLDCGEDAEKRKCAIDTLSRFEISELTEVVFNKIVFRQPKTRWQNAICVLKNVDKTELTPAITQLLTMLQDMNWPGSEEALDILCGLDRNDLLAPLESAICKAHSEKDTMWLGGLKHLVKNAAIRMGDFKNEATYRYLQDADF